MSKNGYRSFGMAFDDGMAVLNIYLESRVLARWELSKI